MTAMVRISFVVLEICVLNNAINLPVGIRCVGDLVMSLPGWNGTLPSRQYSGFLDAAPDAKVTKSRDHEM